MVRVRWGKWENECQLAHLHNVARPKNHFYNNCTAKNSSYAYVCACVCVCGVCKRIAKSLRVSLARVAVYR